MMESRDDYRTTICNVCVCMQRDGGRGTNRRRLPRLPVLFGRAGAPEGPRCVRSTWVRQALANDEAAGRLQRQVLVGNYRFSASTSHGLLTHSITGGSLSQLGFFCENVRSLLNVKCTLIAQC